MRVATSLGLVLALAVVAPAAAQEKPDFTGTWVVANPNGAATNVPTTIVVTESFRRESVSGVLLPSPIISMHVERRAGNGEVTSDNFTIGIIGGVVGGRSADAAPVRRNFAATWDGDRLVLETTWSGRPVDAGTSSLHRETWAIDRGELLMVTTKESIGLADFTATTVSYRRQP
jgi:hypothetical protein